VPVGKAAGYISRNINLGFSIAAKSGVKNELG
jgi:hypothetical protein